MDVFAEVKRIEDEAERLLSDARTGAENAVAKARSDAVAYRTQAERTLEGESARLRAEQQQEVVAGHARIEADFRARKERLDETSRNIDALADWVAQRYLSDNR